MDDLGQRPNPFAGDRWGSAPAPVAGEPTLQTRPDRGTPGTAMLAWIAMVVLVGSTFIMQQMSASAPPPATPTTGIAPPRADDPEAMTLKLLVKMGHFLDGMAKQGGGSQPQAGGAMLTNADSAAHTPENRVRAAIVAGELGGAGEAESRLMELKDDLESTSPLIWEKLPDEDRRVLTEDTKALLEFYGAGTALTPAAEDELVKRHGYFGKLATTFGKPDTDSDRAELLDGGGKLIALLGGFGLLVVAVILGGLATSVVMTVLLFAGRLRARFVPPIPGGSVYLETAAVFFFGFLMLQVMMSVVVANQWVAESNALYVSLGAQWFLVPLMLWPVVRGTSFSQWRRDMGLHAGEGLFTELGAGLVGYLAGIPLLLIAMVVSLIAAMVKQGLAGPGEPPAVENPVVELVTKGGIAPWLLFALGTIWAPLVEECIFRGAMFRHLRGRLGVVLSAAIVAVAFGAAHGYEWMMLGPVIALGFNFSLMREWRGSLIGPIAAHCLHNATVLLMVITLFSLLKD
jgi:membrane protease YdiL (CAAX protease family)